MKKIRVIGAGLAGSEAALTLASLGQPVILIDMKPGRMTPAHRSEKLGELVCSNSLKSLQDFTATGLQKKELELLNSQLLSIAMKHRVPAGNALAVDREAFSEEITRLIMDNPLIEYEEAYLESLPDDDLITIVATGPLTGNQLFASIQEKLAEESLYFYDAVAPIVSFESINMDVAYKKSRYDKGTADYINCPMDKETYQAFYEELIKADLADLEDFDRKLVFEGCMPIEAMARRGEDTLRFGPMKPVGLTNPHTGERPYAVVQLRQEDSYASMYNLVGFQTRLKFPEQKRIFRMIPGLEKAEFLRYGVMHRNTYIASDHELEATFRLKSDPRFYFAGQITGLEGYLCALSSGKIAAINAYLQNRGEEANFVLPEETLLGQLQTYLSRESSKTFAPMNANFGLLPPLELRIKKKQERGMAYRDRSLESLQAYLKKHAIISKAP